MEHQITVTITAHENEGQPFSDDDLLEAVQATLHEVFPTNDNLVAPTVQLVR